jgi:hypothetical protein
MGLQAGNAWRISRKATQLVAEYAVVKSLPDDPDFVWWDPHILKKRSKIIVALKNRYHKSTHKFEIEVPKIWDDCVRLD